VIQRGLEVRRKTQPQRGGGLRERRHLRVYAADPARHRDGVRAARAAQQVPFDAPAQNVVESHLTDATGVCNLPTS
jgi:hypothetical protein